MSESKHRLAIVTGGASGIGRAFCEELSAGGWQVAVCDIDLAAAKEVASKLPLAMAHEIDVASHHDWVALRQSLEGDHARLHLLVNSAGLLLAGGVVDCSVDALKRLLNVNLLGTIWGCQTMLPWIAKAPARESNPPAGVINVASIFAAVSPPNFAAYAASKSGIIAFSESLRGEVSPLGLNVTVAIPGITNSNLFSSAAYSSESVKSATQREASRATISPQQVARDTLNAARRRRLYAVVGRRARFYWRLKRLVPQRLIDRVANRTRKAYKTD